MLRTILHLRHAAVAWDWIVYELNDLFDPPAALAGFRPDSLVRCIASLGRHRLQAGAGREDPGGPWGRGAGLPLELPR